MRARFFLSGPGRLLALVAVACALWAAPVHAGTPDLSFTAAPATLFLITAGLGCAAVLRRRVRERAHD